MLFVVNILLEISKWHHTFLWCSSWVVNETFLWYFTTHERQERSCPMSEAIVNNRFLAFSITSTNSWLNDWWKSINVDKMRSMVHYLQSARYYLIDIVILSCLVPNIYFNCVVQGALYYNMDKGSMWHCVSLSSFWVCAALVLSVIMCSC